MAKISFKGGDDFGNRLVKLGQMNARASIERAVAKAAGIVADAIRSKLSAIPGQKEGFLGGNKRLQGMFEREKKDLLNSLGITSIRTSKDGFTNEK